MRAAASRPAFATLFAVLLAGQASHAAHAASISAQVTDAAGQPLTDAVVYAEPLSGQAAPKSHRMAEIEQKGRKFIPLVTAIQAGTDVSFPNNDSVRHHVYSLSQPKVFELKLYSGTPGKPVNFDKPGTVVLGCNIHDTMVAYIHIVNTPWYAKTDAAGRARIEGLPADKYELKAWHYKLPAGAQPAEQEHAVAADDSNASFKLNTKP
jgi:plastocyanin